MAALPNTNISVTAVKQALGVSSNDVGTLFLHPNVNYWGFNPPGMVNFNAVWGKNSTVRAKLSPSHPDYVQTPLLTPGYNLGYFRGYDHNWVTYSPSLLDMIGSDYFQPIRFDLTMDFPSPFLEGKPTPSPPIEHLFKIEFSRIENRFDQKTAITVYEEFGVIYPYSSFYLDMRYPPDYAENGSLDEGETFYIKVTHISSPERRIILVVPGGAIFQFEAPENPYTELASLQNITAVSAKITPPPTLYVLINSEVYADFHTNTLITVRCEVSTTSNFSSYATLSQTMYSGVNPTPGTPSFVDLVSFDFSNSFSANQISVGQTLYYRMYVNGNWVWNQSMVVLDHLPIV